MNEQNLLEQLVANNRNLAEMNRNIEKLIEIQKQLLIELKRMNNREERVNTK